MNNTRVSAYTMEYHKKVKDNIKAMYMKIYNLNRHLYIKSST